MAKRGTRVRSFWGGTIPFLIIVVPVIALVFKEPDLGTTIVITLTVFTMFFIAGANLLHLGLLAAAWTDGGGPGRPARLPDGAHPDLARPMGATPSAPASIPCRGCWRSAWAG